MSNQTYNSQGSNMKREEESYLRLSSPQRTSICHHSQVFSVILDEDYKKTYNAEEVNRGQEVQQEAREINIDLRPIRWYRDWWYVQDILAATKNDYDRAHADLIEIDVGTYPSYSELKDSINLPEGITPKFSQLNTLATKYPDIPPRKLYRLLINETRSEYLRARDIWEEAKQQANELAQKMENEGTNFYQVALELITGQGQKEVEASLAEETSIGNIRSSYNAMNKAKIRHMEMKVGLKDILEWNKKAINPPLNKKSLLAYDNNEFFLEPSSNETKEDSFYSWMNNNVPFESPIDDNTWQAELEIFWSYYKSPGRARSVLKRSKEYRIQFKNDRKEIRRFDLVQEDNNKATSSTYNEEIDSVFLITKEIFFTEIENILKNKISSAWQEFRKKRQDFENSIDEHRKLYGVSNFDPIGKYMRERYPIKKYVVHELSLYEGGWKTQHGLSMFELIREITENKKNEKEMCHIVVVPKLDEAGKPIPDLAIGLIDPAQDFSILKDRLPRIKFIEHYETTIRWSGYCLGELSHSVNMFPGESREVVVEKATKQTIKNSSKSDRSDITSSKQTSSFEDTLQQELSQQNKSEEEEAQEREENRKAASGQEITNTRDETSDSSFSIKAGNLAIGGGISHDKKISKGHKNINTQSLESAFSNKKNVSSKESREQMKKQISNSIRKQANEVSSENKVMFTSTSSLEREESLNEKEIIKVENSNVGRTVNYNFFQLQNVYKTETRLTDIKILVDTEIEIIKGSGISESRIYNLEEFLKIYPTLLQHTGVKDETEVEDETEKKETCALIAKFVARQVVKNYVDIESDEVKLADIEENVTKKVQDIMAGNGALRWADIDDNYDAKADNDNIYKSILSLCNICQLPVPAEPATTYLEKLHELLNNAKKYIFRIQLNGLPFIDEETHTINTGSFHMDAQVGIAPATEPYLERRREIEKDFKYAEVEHLKGKTQAGVYFPPPSIIPKEGFWSKLLGSQQTASSIPNVQKDEKDKT